MLDFKTYDIFENGAKLYRLSQLQAFATSCEAIAQNCWLLITKDAEQFKVEWALVSFVTSGALGEVDENESYVECIWYGEGYSSLIRECRHSYFGDAGYVFYAPLEAISKTALRLKEFFD